ncbi:dTDP-4-dehydrorhamnose reductase [Dysgonomonas sp. 25]|uniref:dTDP-4-dehydrorhamnose reductase n=1 Tax=Dysgonomonas sp. 25 TaxID=2302933 RepID=UPI0013D2F76C|nr:dTDP-4-dehydrorhamnose reductase [Dysgonomonas sp. 25]NDV67673.1 dTDP-4-dehydrorhamnose reductase [Dysgonomonas sp. 25]
MAFLTGSKQADDQDEAAKNIVFSFELLQKNVLVTGAYGQLGSEIKRLTNINPNNNFRFFFTDADTLDITDIEAIDAFVAENSIKYIINCAAYTAVDKAEDDVALCYKINHDAVLNIAIVAAKHKARVIQISTDYVFDGTNNRPYVESDPVNPQSVYGKSKEEGESSLLAKCPESIIIRTSWLYSIYGNNFVKTMIRLGRERSELNVVADQTGTPTNAADLAAAIGHILDYSEEKDFVPGIYHYSNEGITTWYDFTVEIHKDAGITGCQVSPITTDQYPTKAKRPQYSVLDKTKIKTTFGLTIPEWKDSLAVCVEELLAAEK